MKELTFKNVRKVVFDAVCGLTVKYKWILPEYSGTHLYGDMCINLAAHHDREFVNFMSDLYDIINEYY